MKKVIVTEDGSGHWYIIPNRLVEQFYEDLEQVEEDGNVSIFSDKYSKYMTGGDINNVQLYANV